MIIQSLPLFLAGALNTVLVACLALIIGLSFGLLFGLLSCNKYKSWYSWPIHLYVLIFRGTPVCLQLLLVYFAVPAALGINFSPLVAGVITLGLNSIAYVTEIIRGGINAINQGQWDASYVLGLNTFETIKAIIMPQVFNIVLLPLTSESITLLKETSIVSIIGLCELTRIGMNISARTLDPICAYGMVALIYLCMTTIMSYIAKYIEGRFYHGQGN